MRKAEGRTHQPQVPDLSVFYPAADDPHLRMQAEAVVFDQRQPSVPGQFHRFPGVLRPDGKGFFRQHMLPEQQRLPDPLRVHRRGQGDVNRVDFRILQQRPIPGIRLSAEAVPKAFRLFLFLRKQRGERLVRSRKAHFLPGRKGHARITERSFLPDRRNHPAFRDAGGSQDPDPDHSSCTFSLFKALSQASRSS